MLFCRGDPRRFGHGVADLTHLRLDVARRVNLVVERARILAHRTYVVFNKRVRLVGRLMIVPDATMAVQVLDVDGIAFVSFNTNVVILSTHEISVLVLGQRVLCFSFLDCTSHTELA